MLIRRRGARRGGPVQLFLALALGFALLGGGCNRSIGGYQPRPPTPANGIPLSPVEAARLPEAGTVGTFREVDRMVYPGDNNYRAVVLDPDGGYAYFGTNTSPGAIVKVSLEQYNKVIGLDLKPGEDFVRAAVIDLPRRVAYFGLATKPGKIVKIDLATFAEVGALTLDGAAEVLSAAIDPAGGYAYFGTNDAPGKVARVRLADFTLAGVLDLNTGEDHILSALVDPQRGQAYFGTGTIPGRVVQVRLADFARTAMLTLQPGEDMLATALIDPARGYAYFGANSDPGIVVKLRLDDFTRVGSLVLASGEDHLTAAAMDLSGAYAYFAGGANPATVVKVRLADLARSGAFNLGQGMVGAIALDAAGQYGFFGLDTNPGRIPRLRLADLTWAGNDISGYWNNLLGAAFDATHGYAYFISDFDIIRLRTSDFTKTGWLRFATTVSSIAIDREGIFAYVSLYTVPGQILKVRLADARIVAALTLRPSEDKPRAALIDPSGRYGYFGVSWGEAADAKVVMVRLADMAEVSTLSLAPGVRVPSAVMDARAGFLYFGVEETSSTGHVAKVRMADFTLVSSLALADVSPRVAVIAPARSAQEPGYAFFAGHAGAPSSGEAAIARVRLSDFTPEGVLSFQPPTPLPGTQPVFKGFSSAAVDTAAGYAYFGTSTFDSGTGYPESIMRVRLKDFSLVGMLDFGTDVWAFSSAVLDPASGYAFFGAFASPQTPTYLVRLGLGNARLHVRSSRSFSLPGESLTLTAQVTPAAVEDTSLDLTGTISVTVDGKMIGGLPAAKGGLLNFNLPELGQGTHYVTALYSGDVNFSPAAVTLVQRVGRLTFIPLVIKAVR